MNRSFAVSGHVFFQFFNYVVQCTYSFASAWKYWSKCEIVFSGLINSVYVAQYLNNNTRPLTVFTWYDVQLDIIEQEKLKVDK